MEISEIHIESFCRQTCIQVMSTLAYFSVFRHPLKREEIVELLHEVSPKLNDIDNALEFLENKNMLSYNGGFYFLNNDINSIQRRLKGEIEAQTAWIKAKKYSHLISKFPFVRAVFISGSLSKNYMDAKSDIDYFIVTKAGRLWICRTLLILFKKIFLFNSHRYFCLNYFVDENNLTIDEQNIFTATELLFLKPLYGSTVFEKLSDQNNWTQKFYPNKSFQSISESSNQGSSLKNTLEKVLSVSIFNYLDSLFLKITVTFWKRKFKNTNLRFDNELRSIKGVSKHHPNGFENKIVIKHQQLMRKFFMAFDEIEIPV